MFLAFDVVFVVICVAVACLIGIAICCCLPCIIAILYVVTDQVMTKDFIFFKCASILYTSRVGKNRLQLKKKFDIYCRSYWHKLWLILVSGKWISIIFYI